MTIGMIFFTQRFRVRAIGTLWQGLVLSLCIATLGHTTWAGAPATGGGWQGSRLSDDQSVKSATADSCAPSGLVLAHQQESVVPVDRNMRIYNGRGTLNLQGVLQRMAEPTAEPGTPSRKPDCPPTAQPASAAPLKAALPCVPARPVLRSGAGAKDPLSTVAPHARIADHPTYFSKVWHAALNVLQSYSLEWMDPHHGVLQTRWVITSSSPNLRSQIRVLVAPDAAERSPRDTVSVTVIHERWVNGRWMLQGTAPGQAQRLKDAILQRL